MTKVLLVEDDNNLREIYEARLAAEGYEIVTAKDGEDALAVAKQEKPDLVISDVMMPRISGFEMLDILRNTDGLKHVKVIMLTALGQTEDKTRADSLGADRYLVKSQVTLEDIVKTAAELLNPDAEAAENDTTESPTTTSEPPTPAAPTPAAAPAPEPAVAPEPVAEPATATPTQPEPTAAPQPEPASAPDPRPIIPVIDIPGDQPTAAVATDQPAPETVASAEPAVAPAEPATPPLAPIADDTPAAPVEPVEPVTPVEPIAPAADETPVAASTDAGQHIAEEQAVASNAETEAIEKQIEDFVASQPTAEPMADASEQGTESSNESLIADAANSLQSEMSTQDVVTPTETPEETAAEPSVEAPNGGARIQGKKVIEPPTKDTNAPDLDTLLARESANEQAETGVVGETVVSPTDTNATPTAPTPPVEATVDESTPPTPNSVFTPNAKGATDDIAL